jgi:hypothetical protein
MSLPPKKLTQYPVSRVSLMAVSSFEPHGLFALTSRGTFVSLPPITTDPVDIYGRIKRPGPGHADAYSVFDPCPWNESTDRAFGWHYATHSHIRIGKNGQGVVIVASVAEHPCSSPVPDSYFGTVTQALPPNVRAFAHAWLGYGGVLTDKTRHLAPSTRPYELHGLLFFKVPSTLAFSREVNLSTEEMRACKICFETF